MKKKLDNQDGISFCAQLHLIPAHSSLLQPKFEFWLTLGLPLILWTPSMHNQPREVPRGQTATEFRTGI